MLAQIIQHLYPHAVPDVDFRVVDNGSGPFIAEWRLSDPQPTAAEIDAARAECEAAQQSAARRAEILARLKQIDMESLRPLRAIQAGTATQYDHDRLAVLDAEAATLRAELAGL